MSETSGGVRAFSARPASGTLTPHDRTAAAMDAEPSRLATAADPAGPLARLARWHAALTRLVAPDGRPVRKTLLLAPAVFLLGLPVQLLSVLLSAWLNAPPPEVAPLTAGKMVQWVVAAPALETWFVIGLYCGATALARAALRGTRHDGVAGLVGALAAGTVMAGLHTPYSLGRVAHVGVFFAAQGLQYGAWRREYHFVFAYLALAGTHCANNAIAAGLLLLAQALG